MTRPNEFTTKLKMLAWQHRLKKLRTRMQSGLKMVDELLVEVEEYYAQHWRDDDSPQAEKTFGVKRAA